MKVLLVMIMCSAIQQECLAPHQMPNLYNNYYDCLNAGYDEALKKQKEIGKLETNKHQIFIRFRCEYLNET
jgi:hypothetical protein